MPGRTVLVVDDSAAVRRAVSLMLRSAGYDCVDEPDGAKALERLETDKIDIVVTDLNMPVMNGWKFIEQMRSQREMRFIPVLVLTTECHDDVVTRLKQSGVTGVLQKPIERDELLTALRRVESA